MKLSKVIVNAEIKVFVELWIVKQQNLEQSNIWLVGLIAHECPRLSFQHSPVISQRYLLIVLEMGYIENLVPMVDIYCCLCMQISADISVLHILTFLCLFIYACLGWVYEVFGYVGWQAGAGNVSIWNQNSKN